MPAADTGDKAVSNVALQQRYAGGVVLPCAGRGHLQARERTRQSGSLKNGRVALRLLTNIATALVQYHQFHATLRELNEYSDRDLNDMGVDRGDLTRLAWQEAERRFPLPAETNAEAVVPKAAARSIEPAVAGQR